MTPEELFNRFVRTCCPDLGTPRCKTEFAIYQAGYRAALEDALKNLRFEEMKTNNVVRVKLTHEAWLDAKLKERKP